MEFNDVFSIASRWPSLFWHLTWHTVEQFNLLITLLGPFISLPRNINNEYTYVENFLWKSWWCKLDLNNRLMLVFMWISCYSSYLYLSVTFGIDKSVISMEVKKTIFILILIDCSYLWKYPHPKRKNSIDFS